ncbi:hypothetical protein BO86DRAFT_429272 [Aspergillus japonicus CBS 114.51]|uniref:DUF1680-domain-containing protein n=1 Tax=Aspergillus japonicus CBS 114.51 TaxID=1448312 RepID=A0A8T8X383_ASPJA|nr:hypothetical protein BO86DRAFT_429272 [Aspergillus japonicus CBS 114.51]RAH82390.1 hypothetical protein BO86DRAFT_429272 [Aspergillus japonicus CBS 114.51]
MEPFLFNTFAPGAIRPTGWLQDQIQLSADGLGGNLMEFYRYVQRSTWLGGEYEYSELHESSPYWFNYIVPLAWSLDDDALKSQARYYLDYVLDHQANDGWIGPETTRQTRGIWARSLLFFGLTQYAEADPTQEERIVDAMHKFVVLVHSMLSDHFTGLIENKTLGDNFDPYGFGLSRTHELPISLMWLYDNHPRNNSQIILEAIELMFEGGRVGGRDWTTFFVPGVFPTGGTGYTASGFTHGVNLAEGLRYPTVLHRLNGNTSLLAQTLTAVNLTATYQTSLSGSIVGDEHIGGLSPQRGSELCMAVESMFSYAFLYRFHGVNDFADRAERAAFNALPVGVSPDWWSRQYVTQTNAVWAKNLTENPFYNVNSYSLTYGLEPNFPCCTVNHPQGYPKFVTSSYVRKGDKDIAHVLLGPTTLTTIILGKNVEIICDTKYPFSEDLTYTITSDISFSFAVRIPEWVSGVATAQVGSSSNKKQSLSPDSNGLHYFSIGLGTTTIHVSLPMAIDIVPRNQSVAIYHGPLLYALAIEYNETSHLPLNWSSQLPLESGEVVPKARDHYLLPTSNWQFAIDPSTALFHRERSSNALANPIFAKDAPPVSISVDAYRVNWPTTLDAAALPPIHPPVNAADRTTIKLIPFGAAKLHIAQFPVADISAAG